MIKEHAYFKQAEYGMYVRMALIVKLTGGDVNVRNNIVLKME